MTQMIDKKFVSDEMEMALQAVQEVFKKSTLERYKGLLGPSGAAELGSIYRELVEPIRNAAARIEAMPTLDQKDLVRTIMAVMKEVEDDPREAPADVPG